MKCWIKAFAVVLMSVAAVPAFSAPKGKQVGPAFPATLAAKPMFVKRIVALVREKQPQAKVILHPIFPRGVSVESKYHAAARARNEKTNEILRDFAAKDGKLEWIDFNAKFLDADGWVPKTLMADEIHPTDAGYELWLEALQGRL